MMPHKFSDMCITVKPMINRVRLEMLIDERKFKNAIGWEAY